MTRDEVEVGEGGAEGGGWDIDEDLELPADLVRCSGKSVLDNV